MEFFVLQSVQSSIDKIVVMALRQKFTVEPHSTTVLSRLDAQRKERNFCDVILQVEHKQFHVHRNVLSACSNFFFKMFTTEMKEKFEKTVMFKDITSDAMNSLVEFLYTARIVLTEENVSDILHAASIMQIEDALEVIISYLSDVLVSGNCLYFRKLGHFHSLPKLVAKTDQFILDHFEEISKQDEFLDLNGEELERLFASEKLKVDEEALVYQALVKWVNKDVEKRKRDYSKLFRNLRLQFIPLTYLASTIRKDRLVREFPDCRDLVEDAFFFHANPDMVAAEKPRKSYGSLPDSVICIQNHQHELQVFDVEKVLWNKATHFEGWDEISININSAVATNFPRTTFCGGISDTNEVVNQVVQFNGKRWTTLPPMNVERNGAAAAYYENILYVFGGEKVGLPHYYESYNNDSSIDCLCSNLETYSGMWKVEGKLKNRRSFAAAQTVEKYIYLIGGYMFKSNADYAQQQRARGGYFGGPQKGGYLEASNSTDIYNVLSRSWKDGPVMNTARAWFGAVAINSTIYVFGGFGVSESNVDSAELLVPKSKVWTVINPACRWNLGFCYSCIVNSQVFIYTGDGQLIKFDPKGKEWSNDAGYASAGSYVIPHVCKNNQK